MAELIHKLGIDWKLLLAQAANFLILMFLLRKFLYRPILELLAKRRLEAEQAAENANRIKMELAEIAERRRQEMDIAKKEAEEIIEGARRLGKDKEKELIDSAGKKIETLVADAKRTIEEERVKMMSESRKEIKELVFLVAGKILEEKAGSKTDEKLAEDAIKNAVSGIK
jgi:F-type H+-transporting ATPase subunit b